MLARLVSLIPGPLPAGCSRLLFGPGQWDQQEVGSIEVKSEVIDLPGREEKKISSTPRVLYIRMNEEEKWFSPDPPRTPAQKAEEQYRARFEPVLARYAPTHRLPSRVSLYL